MIAHAVYIMAEHVSYIHIFAGRCFFGRISATKTQSNVDSDTVKLDKHSKQRIFSLTPMDISI